MHKNIGFFQMILCNVNKFLDNIQKEDIIKPESKFQRNTQLYSI